MAEINGAGPLDGPPRTPRERRLAILVALVVAAGAFWFNLDLELRFDRIGAFEQNDVLFDADPYDRLESLAFGRTGGPRTYFVHPVFTNFVTPVIDGGVALARALGLVAFDEVVHARRLLGLGVAPFFGAVQSLLACWLLWRLGLGVAPYLALAFLNAASFSHLVFASLPDHWMLSGAVIVGVHLVLIEACRRPDRPPTRRWVALGTLATAITVTSAVAVGVLHFVSGLAGGRRLAEAARRTLALGVGVGLATAALAGVLALVLDYEPRARPAPPVAPPVVESTHEPPGLTGRHFLVDESVAGKLAQYPLALVDGLTGGHVRAERLRFPGPPGAPRDELLTLAPPGEWTALRVAAVALTALALLLGTRSWLASGAAGRALALACLAHLAFHGLLHSVYGGAYFLYSQHWLASELVLLAGLGLPRTGRLGAVLLWSLVVTALAHNAELLADVFELLRRS